MEITKPQILVYNTHIEIFPYIKGSRPELEKKFCKYNYMAKMKRYVPIAMMCTDYHSHHKLYLPRGVNVKLLEKEFNTFATDCTDNRIDKTFRLTRDNEIPIDPTGTPRNRIQEEAIDFLTGENNYQSSNMYTQLGLNLDTGDGKTFCTISAIAKLNLRAIIIVHKNILKKQWIEEFLNMTDISEEAIMDIEGSKQIKDLMEHHDYTEAKIFVTTHQTLQSFASSDKNEGWENVRKFFDWLHVGVKVIDEMHKYFENSLRIDFFSNTPKTFYLTATFGRGDSTEKKIFKMAYSSMLRYGEQTIYYEEKRKHINFVIVYFHSKTDYPYEPDVEGQFGFSSYKYIDYELLRSNGAIYRVIEEILKKTENINGRILLISPKIESVELLASKVDEMTDKMVGIVHSGQSEEENEIGRKRDIISSTIKSVGEGDNLKGLRIIINTEPIGSDNLIDQLRGRLREYSEDEETFFFHLVDTSVDKSLKYLKQIMPVMKKKCKSILSMRMEV